MQKEKLYRQLFNDFTSLTVMVIGDVMVDSYLWGKVERISPEAPIPIVALKKRENRMGGAANVARNILTMGAKPILCSVIGQDEKGDRFVELMDNEGMNTAGLIKSKKRITTTKFRIFGNSTQILRVDEEVEDNLDPSDHESLISGIKSVLSSRKIDCIIFQDYDKGVITAELISEVINLANGKKIPVTVDPKKKNFTAFDRVTLFKPNLKELREGLRIDLDSGNRRSLVEAVQQLIEKQHCTYVLTTLSEHGVMISTKGDEPEKNLFIPAHMRSISDVSGAGDTVISVASLCLAMNCSPYEIAFISNLAGGLVCEEVGVVPVNKEKLLKEVLALL